MDLSVFFARLCMVCHLGDKNWLIKKHFILFFLRYIFACRLVLNLYTCPVENLDISKICVSEIRELDSIIYNGEISNYFNYLNSRHLLIELITRMGGG